MVSHIDRSSGATSGRANGLININKKKRGERGDLVRQRREEKGKARQEEDEGDKGSWEKEGKLKGNTVACGPMCGASG